MAIKAIKGLAIALLVGCSLAIGIASAATPKSASTGCAVRQTATWDPNFGKARTGLLAPFQIEAVSSGPRCATARVVLSIRNSAGTLLHRRTYRADQVMGLYNASNRAQMRTELRTWITFRGGENFHDNLPAWPRGASEPEEREFPFRPADTITRAQYNAVITQRTPVYCYVQGMESLNCLMLRDGTLVPFGIQSFPG